MLLYLLLGVSQNPFFINYWNELSSTSKNPNMLKAIATGAFYPPETVIGAYFVLNSEIRSLRKSYF